MDIDILWLLGPLEILLYNAYDDLKIALCICPQWSISTPSFALGSLNTALTEAGFNPTQYDINMMSSLYLKENH